MELSKYIKEILVNKDSVIIPNFGAFEKTMLSARIDPVTGEMHPPQTGVVFNSDLKTDSGVLIKYVAEKEGLSEEKSVEEINTQVLVWLDNLSKGESITLPGIGTLSKDSSGSYSYQSTVLPNDFPESFGLPVINLQEKPIIAQTEIPVKEKVKEEQKKTEQKKPEQKKPEIKKATIASKQKETAITTNSGKPKSNKALIVLLIVLVPVIAAGVYTALNYSQVKKKINDTTQYVSGLISGKQTTDSLTTAVKTTTDSTLVLNNDSTEAVSNDILDNYTIIDESTNSRLSPDKDNIKDIKKVHIIAGSFKTRSFASRFRNTMANKGFDAQVLPEYKGMYRVSVASYNDLSSAAKDFDRIKSMDESISYWILVNK
ncbi:MAG: SPOR domain-containing protein [Bacteroidales bacterium]